MDPLSLLDRKTVEDVLDAFVRGKRVKVKTTDRNGRPITITTSKGKGKSGRGEQALEKEVLRQLRRTLTDAQIIDLFQIDNPDPSLIDFNLSNWFADKGRDGIHKLPAVNAALSLANLTLHTSKQVCACKAAEADVLLETLGNEDFVRFVTPGDAVPEGFDPHSADDPTRWQVLLASRASASWIQSQKAMRGEALDTGGSTILQSFTDFNRAVNEEGAQARALAEKALESRVTQIQQQGQAISDIDFDFEDAFDGTIIINGEEQ
jgi:hypothetical protein